MTITAIRCTHCGKEHTPAKTSTGKYCSNACQQAFQTAAIIREWLEGKISMYGASVNIRPSIRKWLIEDASKKCSSCGWAEINPLTGTSPLEVDHIDGNYKNESKTNLRVLCPNCHSLTPTYKALNKGNGRESRRKNPQ